MVLEMGKDLIHQRFEYEESTAAFTNKIADIL